MRIKAWFGFFCLFFGLLNVGAQKAPSRHVKIEQPSNKGTIKVLLCKEVEAANLEVRNGYRIYDPRTEAKVDKGYVNKQFVVKPTLDGIAWGGQYPGIFQIAVVPATSDSTILLNGIQYSGDLYIYQIGNTLSIVNVLPIEDFVKAMLNPVINSELHPEVLAALAIVARTQAYYHSTRSESALWQLDAQKIGYQGACVCSRGNGVDQAVALTHHLVMKSSQHGTPAGFFDATYTMNCAGKTAPYHLIHRREGFTAHHGVDAPLARAARIDSQWRFEIPKEQLAAKMGLEKINAFEVYKDPVSGKVYGMEFSDDDENKKCDFFQLQNLLGDSSLKSSDFTVKQIKGSLVFEGAGEGPGTGLCLFSAQEMAKRGKNAAEILEAFFPEMKMSYMDVKK